MFKNNTIPRLGLHLLLTLATVQSGLLSIDQWQNPGACPSIGPVPACYLVFGSFLLALIGSLSRYNPAFHLGLGFPTLLAIYASIGEFIGFVECPRTASGIPMCYISLLLCLACWVFRIFSERKPKSLFKAL